MWQLWLSDIENAFAEIIIRPWGISITFVKIYTRSTSLGEAYYQNLSYIEKKGQINIWINFMLRGKLVKKQAAYSELYAVTHKTLTSVS